MNEDIKLEYMHLCDYAAPGPNGKVNLMGIFDFFLAPQAPDFYIAAKISVKIKTRYRVSFEIQSSKDNSKIFVDENPIEIPESVPQLSFNILKLLKNINFQNFGKYKFIILVNDLPVGYKEVEVKSA